MPCIKLLPMDNPFAAPEHDEAFEAIGPDFIIYRGGRCLYLSDYVALPNRCIVCNSEHAHCQVFKQGRSGKQFTMKYSICKHHRRIFRLKKFCSKFSVYTAYLLFAIAVLNVYMWVFLIGCVLFTLHAYLERYAMRAIYYQEDDEDGAIFRVFGFEEAFLKAFTWKQR